MADENINSSEVGTDATVNSPAQETDAEQTSEETQTSEKSEKTEIPESEAEEKIDWQKRYLDTQTELTKTKQQIADFGKTEAQRTTAQDYQKFQEEQKKRLDVGTYMTQYKNQDGSPDVAGGLNAWMQAREDNISQTMHRMLGPVSSQSQYLQWSVSKILKKVAPEVVKEQMELEKKIKGLYEEMPALINAPDSLNMAEQIIFSKMGKKDKEKMQKDLTKQIKKSVEQQQGVSISPSKAPTKKQLSAAEAWHQKIIESGRQKTVL